MGAGVLLEEEGGVAGGSSPSVVGSPQKSFLPWRAGWDEAVEMPSVLLDCLPFVGLIADFDSIRWSSLKKQYNSNC